MEHAEKILIVEDEGLIAFDLGAVVHDQTGRDAILVDSVVDAKRAVQSNRIIFGLLDVDVMDGKTFDLARDLRVKGIPFVFTSALRSKDMPADLQTVPLLSKPCPYEELARLLNRMMGRSLELAAHAT